MEVFYLLLSIKHIKPKFLLILLLVQVPLLYIQVASASDTPTFISQPASDKIFLNQTGSFSAPVIMNLSVQFDFIVSIAIVLHFTDTSYGILNWGAGTALSNGLKIVYKNNNLLNNDSLHSNDDLEQYADHYTREEDATTPKNIQITAQYTYPYPYSLPINSLTDLQFYIYDNTTATVYTAQHEFFAFIKGYTTKTIDTSVQQVNERPDPILAFIADIASFIQTYWSFILVISLGLVLLVKKIWF